MKKILSNIFALLLLTAVGNALVAAQFVEAVDTISFNSSLDQSLNNTAISVNSGTHITVIVDDLCRSGGVPTSGTVGGISLTKIADVTSSTLTAGDRYSTWIALGVSAGSQNIAMSGCSGTERVSALALNGVDQTTGYNSAATNNCDSGGSVSGYSCSVTTQYNNSWVAGSVQSSLGSYTPNANSTFPNANNYVTVYTTNAQTPVGLHGVGFTNTQSGLFQIAEIIPFGATKGGGGCGFGFCFMFAF
jgi:hypothetical protein